jgi:surfactin synthase thioesterase subunit
MRWSDRLTEVELWGLQLPGRGSRLDERPKATMEELIEAIVTEVPFTNPFVFFGHSLGALVAYETAVALRDRGLPGPQELFLSAYRAPHLHVPGGDTHTLSAPALLAAVEQEHGGLPDDARDDPELLALMTAGLRADLGIVASYRHAPTAPLHCPVTVLGGDRDHESADDLAAWSRHTTGRTNLQVFPGDHFYFREQTDDVLAFLATALDQRSARALSGPAAVGSGTTLS